MGVGGRQGRTQYLSRWGPQEAGGQGGPVPSLCPSVDFPLGTSAQSRMAACAAGGAEVEKEVLHVLAWRALSGLRWLTSFPCILARQHLLVTLVASGCGQGLEAFSPLSTWRPAPKNTPSFLGPFSSSLPQTRSCLSHPQCSQVSLQSTRIPVWQLCVF